MSPEYLALGLGGVQLAILLKCFFMLGGLKQTTEDHSRRLDRLEKTNA